MVHRGICGPLDVRAGSSGAIAAQQAIAADEAGGVQRRTKQVTADPALPALTTFPLPASRLNGIIVSRTK